MNTNPNAIRILCYGDSNTWGINPETGNRYPTAVRWPGRLQEKLGPGYEVIEEGLSGRTTAADDPKRPGKNGQTYLLPCLETNNPLDLVIVMLGVNDLRTRINKTPKETAQGVAGLLKMAIEYGKNRRGLSPKIVLISPILVDEGVKNVRENYFGVQDTSKLLGKLYQEVAKNHGCEFMDASLIASPSPKDGLHLEPEGHQKLAEAVYSRIKSLNK